MTGAKPHGSRIRECLRQSMQRIVLPMAFAIVAIAAAPVQAQTAIAADPAAVALAPGQHQTIALRGTIGPIVASASQPIVTAAVDQEARNVILTGITIGTAVVHVSDGSGNTIDIPVQVLPPAATVPDRIRLAITGDPASPEFLAARIDAAVLHAVTPTLTPGSSVRAATILPAPQPLGSGYLTSFTVPVNVDPGPGALAVTGMMTVDVQNVALAGLSPVTLSFKDDPERISADGVLSRTTIDARHPTRIYYYHENMRERRRFCVVLSANDSVITHVQIVGAAAGPNIDVMSTGHAATKTFLAVKLHDEGVVVEIAGGKPVLERDTIVGAGEGIVGALDLRVLDGGPVTATVMAIPPTGEPAGYLYGPKLPDDGHTRHGVFDLTGFAQRIIAYTAGGPDATYAYGNRQRTLRNADPADPGRDYGDYGVLQRVTFDLNNPTDAPATLFFYEKPLGGAVRSSFVVNGNVIDIGCVRVPKPYLVATQNLAPHATAALDVLTMTDGGSNYPLEIGVTSTAPVSTPPPISAPEGCFPKPGTAAPAPQPAATPPGH